MVNTDRLCMGCMNDNGGEKVCPICGYDTAQDNKPEYLSVGTWLNANRYLVGKIIEESGDGVTYIAWDNDQNAVVNIKEYFPSGIAVRSTDRLTVVPNENKGIAFNRGKEEFVALFTTLARMDESTAILGIVDAFESGGTVYAVQSTVSGTTLKAFLIRHGGTLKWEQVKPLFMPLIATVSRLNEAGIVHRGISPDNIIVGRDGKLRLTGFCIKSAKIEHSEFLPSLASGYAAPEQYLENDSYSQSCDVYALGAVIFRCLIGTTPPDAKDRLVSDKLAIPSKVAETVPRAVLVATANALKVDKTQRVQTTERFYKMLEAIASGTVMMGEIKREEKAVKKKGSSAKYVLVSILATALVFVIAIVCIILFSDRGDSPSSSSQPVDNQISSTAPSSSSQNEGYGPGTVLYKVPNLIGEEYTKIYGDLQTEYSHFTFQVAGRVADESVPKGSICKQSVAGESEAERGTVIEIYISQGPSKVAMPKIVGMSLADAKCELFDAGFYSDTIIVRKGYDASAKPGQVYKVTYAADDSAIKSGSKISVNEIIVIYYLDPDTVIEESQPESSQQTGSTE